MSSLYGLIGEKLGHSLSPKIHSEIFKEINIDAFYHVFEVERENIGEAVKGLKALGAGGVNVTIPYKVEVMDFLDGISPEAENIGAVNTLDFADGRVIGYNTDYYGFGMLLRENFIDIKGKKAVILGSGGAALSVINYLVDNDVSEVKIATRDIGRTMLKKSLNRYDIVDYGGLTNIKGYDMIINCTPCGMFPHVESSPVEKKVLGSFNLVIDLIYNPKKTLILRYADEIGIKGINGLDMLIGQALAAEEIWNKRKLSRELFIKIHNLLYNLLV